MKIEDVKKQVDRVKMLNEMLDEKMILINKHLSERESDENCYYGLAYINNTSASEIKRLMMMVRKETINLERII